MTKNYAYLCKIVNEISRGIIFVLVYVYGNPMYNNAVIKWGIRLYYAINWINYLIVVITGGKGGGKKKKFYYNTLKVTNVYLRKG